MTEKLTPDDALQTLWDDRNKGIGRAGVLAVLVTVVGTVTSGIGGTLLVKYYSVDTAVAAAKNDLANGVGLPPIGSVIAWPAAVAVPDRWRICNGDAIEVDPKSEIARVIDVTYGAAGPGKVKLPNFQGYFLRGQQRDSVMGQPQAWTTGLPRSGFIVSSSGGHSHETLAPAYSPKGMDSNSESKLRIFHTEDRGAKVRTDASGEHSHTISGGDKETAPDHYLVHWIIRVK